MVGEKCQGRIILRCFSHNSEVKPKILFFCFQNELQLKCSQVVDRKQMELKTLKKQAEEKIFALEEQLAQAKRGFNGLPFSYLNDDATSPAILS